MASPLCTSVVLACMSAACGKDPSMNLSLFNSSKRPSQYTQRMKLVPKCINGNGAFSAYNLPSSFSTFKPCKEYSCNSKGLCALSLAVFGENVFNLFGSKTASITRRRNNRPMKCDAQSGNKLALIHVLILFT